MHVGKVIVKAEFQEPYCLLKYKFLLDKKNLTEFLKNTEKNHRYQVLLLIM